MADSSIRPAWLWIPWKKSPKNWRRKLAFFWNFLQIFRNFAIFWRQFQTSHFGWKKMEKSAPKWTFFQSNVVLWTWQPLSILETFFDILAYFWIQSDRIGREWGKWPLFLDKFGTKSPNLANLGSTLDFRFQTKNRIFGSKFYIHSILNHWPIIGPTFGAENRHFSPKKAQNSEKPIPMPGSPEPENLTHPSIIGSQILDHTCPRPGRKSAQNLAPKFHIFQAKKPQNPKNQQIKKHLKV